MLSITGVTAKLLLSIIVKLDYTFLLLAFQASRYSIWKEKTYKIHLKLIPIGVTWD